MHLLLHNSGLFNQYNIYKKRSTHRVFAITYIKQTRQRLILFRKKLFNQSMLLQFYSKLEFSKNINRFMRKTQFCQPTIE